MDSLIVRSTNKRLRPNAEGSQDYISNLPDVLIGHILSRVPTKAAVRTSVLSKRWKYLWTFMTVVKVEDRDPESRKKIKKTIFCNFLERVLLLLKSSRMHCFTLNLQETYSKNFVDKWIYGLLSLNVQKLDVNSEENINISWPIHLESSTVKFLMENMNQRAVCVSNFVCFSSLTYLRFSRITFTCDCFKSQTLVLKFPVLKRYDSHDSGWLDAKEVIIEVPQLEDLSIKYSALSMNEEHTKVKFRARRLAEFTYSGSLLPAANMLEISASYIASAHIDIDPFVLSETREEKAFVACLLLRKFSNIVKFLAFERPVMFTPMQIHLPVFRILTGLELGYLTHEVLLNFLQNTPMLKTLTLTGIHEFKEELAADPEKMPSCFTSSLQEVNFIHMFGKEEELHIAKFMMENAKGLKMLSFSANMCLPELNIDMLKEKINSFAKKGLTVDVNDGSPHFPSFRR